MTAKSVLPPLWEVPQNFRDRLGDQAGRQRAMLFDGHLLLVLHRPPEGDDPERKGRFFWRDPAGEWKSSELRGGANAVRMHLDEYAELLDQYDEQLEQADQSEDYFRLLTVLAPLHRAARHAHEVLQEARQMCPEERALINLRDRAYQLERTAELLLQETKNALDYLIARQTEQQARSSHRMAVSAHRLNIMAAFFFPLATLAALFGVNLATGLEPLESAYAPLPFLVITFVGLICGLVFVKRM